MNRRKIAVGCVFGIISFVFLNLFSPYTTLLNNYHGIDTSIFWVIGRGITKGKTLYVDLFDNKGPMIFYMWGLGSLIGGGKKWGVLFLQTISLAISLLYLWKLSDLLELNKKKKVMAFVLFLLLLCGMITEGGLTEEWTLPCNLYATYISFRYLKRGGKERLWVSAGIFGILFSFMGWMRINNSVYLASLILVLTCHLLVKKKYLELIKCMVAFVGGNALISGPIILWFLRQNALSEMIYGSITYNLWYASDGLKKSMKEIGVLVGYEGVAFVLFFFLLLQNRKQEKTTEEKWCSALIFVPLLFSGFSCMLGYTWIHYFMAFLPCIIMVFLHALKKVNVKIGLALLLFLLLPYSWQIARNAGKCFLFNFCGYYDELFAEVNKMGEIIPEEEKGQVWSIGWTTAKYYAANDMIPCFKVFDMPLFLKNSETLCDDAERMLSESPPLWIFRFEGDSYYLEGLEGLLNKRYILEETIRNKGEGLITNGQDIAVELWRRAD